MPPDHEPPFLLACRNVPAPRVPVWFMRQAGRSLPEYRAIRGTGSILDAVRDPDLATEITLQPVRRYGVDAAILYSDIVVPVAALGFGVEIHHGVGPVVAEPFRDEHDLDRLRPLDPEADCPYVQQTVRQLIGELGDVPLIGFAGAPFTVASYLVEGGPSRTLGRTKALMLGRPDLWAALLDRLAGIAIASLRAQVLAGARAIQLFDSWAGTLNPAMYERHVLPASARVFAGVADLGVPGIHFGVTTGELLPLLAKAGASVVGVDWRVPLDEARARLGPDVAVQGNLDPAVCLAPWPAVKAAALEVLTANAGRPGHVFNLGHGVLPDTDPATLERLVELVHGWDGSAPGMTTGLLVMAYGTPASPDDVEAYYTHIRRGRPPSAEQLAELSARYQAIGGVSPLAERTRAQVDAVAAALEADEPGRWRVALGNKHAPPFLEDAVATLARGGALGGPPGRIVGLVLAPHYSRGSVGEYHARAGAAAAERGVSYAPVESWWALPAWVEAQAARVRAALAALPARTEVLFTAHSLPERVLAGDPYADELRASAEAVAAAAGLDGGRWSLAWQSAGRTPEPWRGPDVADVIRTLGTAGGVDGVLVCPQGFVSDHLEVLYDLDVDARRVATEAGLAFARTASLNDEPAVMAALAGVARDTAARVA